MAKSREAFRTISEVADWLETPAHVLRFWESRFNQVKPVKRAGGRRYYRPNDMLLLGGIKKLLHEDGITIKGVQKILREKGVKHVVALSHPLSEAEVEAPALASKPTPVPQATPAPKDDNRFSIIKTAPAESTAPPQVLRDHPDRPDTTPSLDEDDAKITALYGRLQNLRDRMQKQA